MERELWKLLYEAAVRLDEPWGSWKFSASDILGVYFWSVVHDRPMTWSLLHSDWPNDLQPKCLPSQATLSRRMRQDSTLQLMLRIEQAWLGLCLAASHWLRIIDGKSLSVSGVSKDPDAGYGRGAGGMQKGYKLHAIWGDGPLPLAWALAPINVSEKTMAAELIPTLPGAGYLLGDSEYDSNKLYDLAHTAGYQLLARKRQKHRGVGHRRQSPYRLRSIELTQKDGFGKAIYRYRRQIERDFGTCTNFGGGLICLPPWVRRITRVRNWSHAKLLVNAARWLLNHPEKLAIA